MTNEKVLSLSVRSVELDVPAATRWEALAHIGKSLERSGSVHTGYSDSLHARERRASTYLGHGIAVPHALHVHDYLLVNPGLAFTRFTAPVPWDGERVTISIAIAASAAEHVEILCRITALLAHPTHLDVLRASEDPGEITRILRET
ncbi:PTS sugar transporter subunit IIA [Amycolatopsis solani]|uniref:PTS sugar transporter subunit IIA n=1 Tax=Amycolatopsis solani TaxID=3028615 RepID=UPI0025B1AD4E|nr:PTS sugar transporter subunit IIA [Amycolatopsis sp. MEP2-6]